MILTKMKEEILSSIISMEFLHLRMMKVHRWCLYLLFDNNAVVIYDKIEIYIELRNNKKKRFLSLVLEIE
jgi:hypothetical protein